MNFWKGQIINLLKNITNYGTIWKKQTDDCEDLGEALAQTNSGRREVELVIGDDGELEAMTPDEAEKSGKEKVGTTIGTKPYYNDKE